MTPSKTIGTILHWLTSPLLKLCLLGLLLVAKSTQAAPWIDPGDEVSRHHLQTLVDSGVINTLTTSWPIMWSNINAQLDQVELSQLSQKELWSYRYLRHELRKAKTPSASETLFTLSNSVTAISDFSTDSREKYESSASLRFTGDQFAFRLKASYIRNPEDGQQFRPDGSFASYMVGNWAIGVGAIDRWWGPGWESSMILSHTARPTPSVFLQRGLDTPFKLPVLSWLGPWQFTTFLSQLESGRAVPEAMLWGGRFNFRPLQSLEIGISRAALWGGDGRSGNLDTLADLLLGQAGDEDERGYQLGGLDARWSFHHKDINGAVYGQVIGDDKTGGLPSRHPIGMAGIEANTLIGNRTHLRLSLETQNTQASFLDSDKDSANIAYEHDIYQSGYRYYNRPMGASTDNDSETHTLRAQLYFDNGHDVNISWSDLRINHNDNTGPTPSTNSPFTETIDTSRLSMRYALPLSDRFKLAISIFRYSDPVQFQDQELSTGGYIQLHGYW